MHTINHPRMCVYLRVYASRQEARGGGARRDTVSAAFKLRLTCTCTVTSTLEWCDNSQKPDMS